MLDRSKLAAPLFAQAAAFVVVLVIGGFTGHASTPAAPAPETTTPGTTASAPVTRQAGPTLTVRVVPQRTGGVSVSGSEVKVLQNESLTSVASGPLNQALEFAANVPPGQYQVCIDPPIGWGSAVPGTRALGGWICTAADVGAGPASVTFRLAVRAPQAGQ